MRTTAAATFLAALSGSLLVACSKPEPTPEPVRSVRTLIVSNDVARGSHEYAAEVRARLESRLAFRVGGKLVRRHVNLGDSVKAGQVLAQLDPQDLKLGQDAARAAVQAAQVNHQLALADFKRFKELRDQNFISGAELERRDTAVKAAQAQLDQARAQSSLQSNQAAYSTLLADASGVVTAVEAEPGAVVAAGAPVLRLAHDGPRDLVFSVPEGQLARVRALAGQAGAVKLKLWGSAGELLNGTVREVSASADPTTRTFVVKADAGKAALRLGQTASVLVDEPTLAGITKLPLAAVMEVPGERQGRAAVWLVDKASMTVKSQPIQVAGADGNSVVVTAGLSPGQTVVTAGVHVLTQGQKVRLYGAPAAAASAGTAAASAASAGSVAKAAPSTTAAR